MRLYKSPGTYISALLTVLLFSACEPENMVSPTVSGERHRTPKLPQTSPDYQSDFERHRQGSWGGREDRVSNEGALLGRVLFYDEALSHNNSISCASCHKQEVAFADPVQFSMGFETRMTKRNSPAIQNAFNSRGFFWDLRAKSLEEQVVMPIQDHIEMGIDDLEELSTKLSTIDYYDELFTAAYGSSHATPDRISDALAQYLRSMISRTSKKDLAPQSFTALEKRGEEVFTTNCMSGCHWGPDFGGLGETANIGLDLNYEDEGEERFDEHGEVMGGWFKVPSLRNIALTGPYMHDGRFASLEEVVNHYNSGIKNHPFLSMQLRENPSGGTWGEIAKGPVKKMNLSENDKDAIIAFLHTLTDEQFISDPKFSDPFKY